MSGVTVVLLPLDGGGGPKGRRGWSDRPTPDAFRVSTLPIKGREDLPTLS
jgi:hypothetical protein